VVVAAVLELDKQAVLAAAAQVVILSTPARAAQEHPAKVMLEDR
jgi:hypothetical protein